MELDKTTKDFFDSAGEVAPADVMEAPAPEPAAAEPAPEPVAEEPKKEAQEPEKTQDPAQEAPKMVPLAALHEARAQLKELKAKEKETEHWKAEQEAKLKLLFERAEQRRKQEEEAQIPKFEEDPATHLLLQQKAQAQNVEELSKWRAQQEQQAAQQAQLRNFTAALNQRESEFRKQNADYDSAAKYLQDMKIAELRMYGVPEDQIANVYQNWAIGVAANTMRLGKNPAEVFYSTAKQFGYKIPAPATETPKGNPEQKKLETLAQGMEASKSLPGGQGESTITLEALAKMSFDDVEKIVASDEQWNKLMNRMR